MPDDFPGYTWKAAVKAGDSVMCGDPLLFAKEDDRLCLTSPVAGTVREIHRGERRKIERRRTDSERFRQTRRQKCPLRDAAPQRSLRNDETKTF